MIKERIINRVSRIYDWVYEHGMTPEKWDKLTDAEKAKWKKRRTVKWQIITFTVMYLIFFKLFKCGIL